MKLERLVFGCNHALPVIQCDFHVGHPLSRARLKPKGHDDGIRFKCCLRALYLLRSTTPVGPGFSQACFHDLDTNGFAKIIDNAYWLSVEEELHTFLASILNLATRTRHIFLIPAVNTEHLLSLLADRCPHAVHRSITTAQYDNSLTFQIDEVFFWLWVAHFFIHIPDEVIERLVNTGQVLTIKTTLHRCVGSHAKENSVELFE